MHVPKTYPLATSPFREIRILRFAVEKAELSLFAPRDLEWQEVVLKHIEAHRKNERRRYERALREPEDLPLLSEVLNALDDRDAELVFAVFEERGVPKSILRTRRNAIQRYAAFEQQVHEQELYIHALSDVRIIQQLLLQFMKRRTGAVNTEAKTADQSQDVQTAAALLEAVNGIATGNCSIPDEGMPQKEKERFCYRSIRDLEQLRDEAGNSVVPLPLLRSLALVHLHTNYAYVDLAMDTRSIEFPSPSGEKLLFLAQSDLSPKQCKSLHALARSLRKSGREPSAEDLGEYKEQIAKLLDPVRTILTLLHHDVTQGKPSTDRVFGRRDLQDQQDKGGDIVTGENRAVLFRELVEYLSDYVAALAEREQSGKEGKPDGFMIRNAYGVYRLLRENTRKYLLQGAVDNLYLTGSDHGIRHLIQGDVRQCVRVAEELKWPVRERVFLRQIAADHDMGYANAGLQHFGMRQGIPLENGYYGLLRDHPLYSSALFEVHHPFYEGFFGKEGAHVIGQSVLDHSEVKGDLCAPDPADRLQALFCRIDCAAVCANVKTARAFTNEDVLTAMSMADEAVEFIERISRRMRELEQVRDDVSSDEYRWLAGISPYFRTVAVRVEKRLMDLRQTIYEDIVLQQAYHHAIDRHFDPFHPVFPVDRDFGSNAVSFLGVEARQEDDRLELLLRFGIDPLFFAIPSYFGPQRADHVRLSALRKAYEDFGGRILDDSRVAHIFDVLRGSVHGKAFIPEERLANLSHGGMGRPASQQQVRFEFEIPEPEESASVKITERLQELAPLRGTVREIMEAEFERGKVQGHLRKLIEQLELPVSVASELNDHIEQGPLPHATVPILEKYHDRTLS